MRERPIIMRPESVCGVLEGRKLQTRRVVKPEPGSSAATITALKDGAEFLLERWPKAERAFDNFGRCDRIVCPYGVPGDRLWVREAWAPLGEHAVIHRATNIGYAVERWRSPIYMPRWASRILLEITDVRVQRVQEITEEDAIAEGTPLEDAWQFIDVGLPISAEAWITAYADLWNRINLKRGFGWDVNPWAWAISFRRVEG